MVEVLEVAQDREAKEVKAVVPSKGLLRPHLLEQEMRATLSEIQLAATH